MVVSVIEITKIALLVMVGRAEPFMARIIRHHSIIRKCRRRANVVGWLGHRGIDSATTLPPAFRTKRFSSGSFMSNGISLISAHSSSGIGVVR